MTKELKEKDLKLLAYAWLCLESAPNVDHAKLGAACGYTKSSAQTFGSALKKLRENPPGRDITADDDASAPGPKKRGRKAAKDDDGPGKKRGRKAKAEEREAREAENETKVETDEIDDGALIRGAMDYLNGVEEDERKL